MGVVVASDSTVGSKSAKHPEALSGKQIPRGVVIGDVVWNSHSPERF